MKDEKFIIRGMGGRRSALGALPVFGAKNAAIKAFATPFLFRDEVRIDNIPNIEDVARMKDLVRTLDVGIKEHGARTISLHAKDTCKTHIPEEIAKRLRASVVLTGPLLARFGSVSFPHPGGCLIGARPIDLFLRGFQKMGARVSMRGEEYVVTLPQKKLYGAEIFFKHQSVTGTETFMMAGVGAKGKTVIKNAALEPEISYLADFLNACGARIHGAGTPTIEIMGTSLLSAKGHTFVIIPDRIEAGSFLILGALAAKDLVIKNCNPSHLEALIEVLETSGVSVEKEKDSLSIGPKKKTRVYTSVDVRTHEYPGFPTDLQAPIAVYFTQTNGKATIFETIFEGRFRYIEELRRMGAHIDVCDPHRIMISGPTNLAAKELESPDLRAGLAYILAAIVAKGESVIHNIYNIDRGYERVEERLKKIGVNIERVTEQ